MDSNILKANVLSFFRGLITMPLHFFIPLFLTMHNFSGAEIGLLIGLYSIAGLITTLPIGIINDFFSVKKMAILGFLLMAIFTFALNTFHNFFILIPFFLIGGLGLNMNWISLQSIMYKARQEKEGKKFGVYQFFLYAGNAIGAAIGGVILLLFGFNNLFSFFGLILIACFMGSFLLKEIKGIQSEFLQYKKEFLTKNVLLFIAAVSFFTFHWGAEQTSYALFLKQAFSLNYLGIGLYMAVPVAFLAVFTLIGGNLFDKKHDYKKIFMLAIALSAIGQIVMTANSLEISFAARIVHEIGDGLAMISMIFWTAQLFKAERLGGHGAAVTTISLISQAIGSIIFGPLGQAFGYAVPLWSSAIIMLLAIPFIQKTRVKETNEEINLKKDFGSLKRKMSGQKFKYFVRKEGE